MKQPIKNNTVKQKTKKVITNHKKKKHPQYGTSKLEEDFAKEFLDKLDLEYEYQFEAKEIGRWFDFKVGNVLIEVDGDYW